MFSAKYRDNNDFDIFNEDNSLLIYSITGKLYSIPNISLIYVYTKGDEDSVTIDILGSIKDFTIDNELFTISPSVNLTASANDFVNINTALFDEYKIDVSFTVGATKSGSYTIGTGDGATTTFSGVLPSKPLPTAVTVSYTIGATAYSVTDDGAGNISDANVSGTIDYNTGDISLTFTTAPDSGTNIDATYGVAGNLKILVK